MDLSPRLPGTGVAAPAAGERSRCGRDAVIVVDRVHEPHLELRQAQASAGQRMSPAGGPVIADDEAGRMLRWLASPAG